MGAHFAAKIVEIEAADKMGDSASVRDSMIGGGSKRGTHAGSIQHDMSGMMGRDTSVASVDPNKQTISQYLTQEKQGH